jgi:Peptidase family M28
MARGNSKYAAATFTLGLLLLIGVGLVGVVRFQPPAPLPTDAPLRQFSAARAQVELSRLLGDETPHPIGSDANRSVKARLVARLAELGIATETQTTIGCSSEYAVCGPVENVLAQIPGERESAVLLMAHYDSVNVAAGAGDDGAGVATLLEVARIVQSDGPRRNSVLFAFTDGEEAGLLGAEAFFAEHPWAKRVDAVINLEGRGSSGPSILIRSGPSSGHVLDIFRAVAAHPYAASLAEEVFKRMPNDTDFSVSIRAGAPGFDFAFAGDANHYHSPLDNIANLDPATLQHHGENVMPLVQELAGADLSVRAPNYVYADLTSSLWLAYRPATGLIVAISAIALLALATWRRWQGLAHFSGAFGIVVLALAGIGALEFGGLALADRITGARVAWPAEPWPWRLLVYAIPVLSLALLRPLVRRVGFWNSLLASWWLWGLLVLAQAVYTPFATHVMLPATTAAAVVIVVLAFVARLDRPVIRCNAALINALVAGYFMLPMAYIGEITQGWNIAPVVYTPLALVAVTLLPLLDRGRVRNPRRIALIAIAAASTWLFWAPLYSPQRPQHLNFTYTVDADAGRATYSAWSPAPLPSAVRDALPFEVRESPSPWVRDKLAVAPAPLVHRASAVLESLPTTGTTRRFVLRPGAATRLLGLVIDKAQPIAAIRIAGRPISLEPRRSQVYRWVYAVAPPADGISIEIDAAGDAPIEAYLVDRAMGLPAGGRSLIDARGVLAMPVNFGDTWEILSRVKL